jgi:mgtE-like transporter
MFHGATIAIKGRLSQFFNTVPGQTLLALSFNVVSLFSGGLMAVFTPEFTASPWILALFPPVLTVRGGIGGVFSGNLATMLHLGLVKPQLRDNTDNYYSLVKSVMVITVLDAIVLGIVSFILNIVSGNASLQQWFIFILVPTVVCVLAVSVSIPLTSYIAIVTYNRGLDPDILVYPILASLNDIIVTLFFVGTVFLILYQGIWIGFLIVVFIIVMIVGIYLTSNTWTDRFFQQTLREGTFIVIVSSLFGSVNGLLLSRLGASLARHPGLMAMYPALTNSLGNIGSIIGSKKTTGMALGVTRGVFEDIEGTFRGIMEVEIPAALMHIIFALTSYLLTGPGTPGISLFFLLITALGTNLLSFLIISVFALYSANQAYQRGLNPDNIVIPAITTLSDTTATICVSPAIIVAMLIL